MDTSEYEHCQLCDDKTGHAGAGDGSIYCVVIRPFSIEFLVLDGGDEIGPLCSRCYNALIDLDLIED